LAGEYESCAAAFHWSTEDIRAVAQTSIEASFASASTKHNLLAELASW